MAPPPPNDVGDVVGDERAVPWDALFRVLPILGGAIAGLLAVKFAPQHAPRDFFEIGAQVEVVLILALLFQSRLTAAGEPLPPAKRRTPTKPRWLVRFAQLPATRRFDEWTERWFDPYSYSVFVTRILAILLAGELNALAVVMRTHSTTANPQTLMATIAFSLLALAAALAEPLSRPPRRATKTDGLAPPGE